MPEAYKIKFKQITHDSTQWGVMRDPPSPYARWWAVCLTEETRHHARVIYDDLPDWEEVGWTLTEITLT